MKRAAALLLFVAACDPIAPASPGPGSAGYLTYAIDERTNMCFAEVFTEGEIRSACQVPCSNDVLRLARVQRKDGGPK